MPTAGSSTPIRKLTLWRKEPEVAVTVTVAVTLGAFASAAIVTVCCALPERLKLDGDAVTPVGSTPKLTLTLELKP
jgi:hypothetical protein